MPEPLAPLGKVRPCSSGSEKRPSIERRASSRDAQFIPQARPESATPPVTVSGWKPEAAM
jgi:hypothetical protein